MATVQLQGIPGKQGYTLDTVTQLASLHVTGVAGAGVIVEGSPVRSTVLASAVVSNTTSTAVALPNGSKTIYGTVTGTGSVTQTQAIYGGPTTTYAASTAVLLGTITLSGTTTASDALPVITANFPYYFVVTTATTGTGASGTVTAYY